MDKIRSINQDSSNRDGDRPGLVVNCSCMSAVGLYDRILNLDPETCHLGGTINPGLWLTCKSARQALLTQYESSHSHSPS